MLTIYFLYGLAFIMLGVIVFTIPKKSQFINLFDDLWLLGLFGFIHGTCEWIDLFILRGRPFNVEILKTAGDILFPVSFLFLVMFAAQLILRVNPKFSWLKFFGPVVFLGWGLGYFLNRDSALSNVVARYFICLPGSLLSAIGFFLIFKKTDKTKLPRLISVSTLGTIFVFILYGFFSGLIVPEKNFLLASFLNYSSFKNFVGIPVQFFRMACAIFLSVSLFGIIGVFELDEKGRIMLKGGIRQQVTMLICSATLILISVGIFLIYLFGFYTMRNNIVNDYAHISSLLGKYLVQSYKGEIEDARIYATRLLWIDFVEEKNLTYQGLSEDDKQRFFKEMDQKWIAAGYDSPLVSAYQQ